MVYERFANFINSPIIGSGLNALMGKEIVVDEKANQRIMNHY